jgi:hypothetical protein
MGSRDGLDSTYTPSYRNHSQLYRCFIKCGAFLVELRDYQRLKDYTVEFILHTEQVCTQNFSLGGGGGADPEAIYDFSKSCYKTHVVRYNVTLSATTFIYIRI